MKRVWEVLNGNGKKDWGYKVVGYGKLQKFLGRRGNGLIKILIKEKKKEWRIVGKWNKKEHKSNITSKKAH